jgi:hypothetical protein
VPLTYEQMVTLLGVALLTALVGFCCNGIARDLVSGSPGSLGWGSLARTGGTVGAAASVGAPVAGGAVRAGASLSRGAVATGTNLIRGIRGAAGRSGGNGIGGNGQTGNTSAQGGNASGSGSQAANTAAIPRSSGTGSPFD